ncbi:capsular polysaccharide export protein, LipB/KpsS family [Thermosynechococcus sichuanensis]|nr:hypothetical protein [Thermosynechococcus vestitus]
MSKYNINILHFTAVIENKYKKTKNINAELNDLNVNLISHEKAIRCDYSDYAKGLLIPLNIDIFNQMKPYESQIISSIYRWRFSDYVTLQQEYIEHLKFWYWYLVENKINLYIDLVPHEIYTGVIYYLSKILNIKTILIHPSPVYGSFILMEDWRESSKETQQLYLNIKNPNMDLNYNFVNFESEKPNYWNPIFTDFLKKQELEEYPVYMKGKISKNKKINNRFILKINKPSLEKIAKITEWLFMKTYNLSRKTNRILHPIVNFVFSNYLESISVDSINNEEKYIYFPLHYQPECTTSPLGDVFENQLIAIEWIICSKPKDVLLYVREHPAQNFDTNTIRYKSLKVYKRIASMHEVKFISRNISTFELIRKSCAVATITGTVGLEAIYKEKPVLMFGYHVHQYAPGVFPIRTLDDCSLAMEKIFKEGFKPSKRDVFFFLAALQETSVPVNYFSEKEMNDIKKTNKFSDFLYAFIKKLEICNSNSS